MLRESGLAGINLQPVNGKSNTLPQRHHATLYVLII